MKKLFTFLIAFLLISTLAFAIPQVQITGSDGSSMTSDTGNQRSINITLSGTPGTVTAVTISDTAKGFKLYPRTNDIRFAVNEDVVAVGTSNLETISAATLTVGGVAKADQWEVRLLTPGTSRVVKIVSATASVVVEMETF